MPPPPESLLLREDGDFHLTQSSRGKKKLKKKNWSKSHSQTPGFCQLRPLCLKNAAKTGRGRARQKWELFCPTMGWHLAGPLLRPQPSKALLAAGELRVACPGCSGLAEDTACLRSIPATGIYKAPACPDPVQHPRGGRGGENPAVASPYPWGEGPQEPARAVACLKYLGRVGSHGSEKRPKPQGLACHHDGRNTAAD